MPRAAAARWEAIGRLIGALREGALLVDCAERRVAHSNLAAEQLLGARRSLRDQPLAALLADPQQLAWLNERLEGCLAARVPVELDGLRLLGAGNKPVVVNGTAIPAVDRKPAGWILLLRAQSPATDRAVERALARRMLTVAQLSADLSHKARNLSTATLAGLGQLEAELADTGAAAHDELRALQQAIAQGDALVDRFLAFCRGQPIATGTFDVGQAIARVTELLEHTLPASVALEVDRSAWPDALFARGGPELAQQVLLGVALALRRALLQGGTLRLDVADPQRGGSGRGPAGAADGAPARSCELTLRASPTATTARQLESELGGERELLAPLGARLEIRADASRQALEARLGWPLDTGTAERERVACSGRGERVLLVAAASYPARMMLSVLRAGGYAVELLSSPAALRDALAAARPALVILDDSAGAAAECLPLLDDGQRTLLIVGAEPAAAPGPAATMTVCRPFQLADVGAWVARLLAEESLP